MICGQFFKSRPNSIRTQFKQSQFYDICSLLREIMRKVVRKGKEKDPMETIEEKLTNIT